MTLWPRLPHGHGNHLEILGHFSTFSISKNMRLYIMILLMHHAIQKPEKVGTKASSSHRHMQGSEPPLKDATSPASRNVTNQPGTHTHTNNMATASSKTVQTRQTQTHDWQAHLNQSQNIFRSALHRQLPSIQPPSPKKRQPPLVRCLRVWARGGCTVGYVGFGRGYFIGEGG